jgi:hypothetical protein
VVEAVVFTLVVQQVQAVQVVAVLLVLLVVTMRELLELPIEAQVVVVQVV